MIKMIPTKNKALFNVEINGVKRPIAIIILGANNNQMENDVQAILNWIKITYE